MTAAIQRLLGVIGYPTDSVSAGQGFVVIKVDGYPVRLSEGSGLLVLSCPLDIDGEEVFLRLVGYAAGRLLKEDATLAWDPRSQELILWQSVPAAAGEEALRRVFEVFTASCDWWIGRAKEDVTVSEIPQMMIRP